MAVVLARRLRMATQAVRVNQCGPSQIPILDRRFGSLLHRAGIPRTEHFLLTSRSYSTSRNNDEKEVKSDFWEWHSEISTSPKGENMTPLRSMFQLLLTNLPLPMLRCYFFYQQTAHYYYSSHDTGSSSNVKEPDNLTMEQFEAIVRETTESLNVAMEEVCLEVKELNPDNKEDAIYQRYLKRADALSAEIHVKHGLTREVLSAAMMKYQQEPAFLKAMTELQQEQAERFANAASIFNGDLDEDFFKM